MITLGPDVVPVLCIFDPSKAKEFYVDFLGFEVAFEHRFGENFPLYFGITHSRCTLHLSEHHGDAAPHAHVRIRTTGLDQFVAALQAKDYRYAKPGRPETTPWGSREITVTDPLSNRLTFYEQP